MRQILKMTAAALALVAAGAGAADAKFIGRMNIGGRIDPAAATPATPAAPVTFSFEGARSGCDPFSGPFPDSYAESQGGVDLTATVAGTCFNNSFGNFSGQATFEGLDLRNDAADVSFSFTSQVTLKSFAVTRSGAPTPVTVVSSSGGSYTFTAGNYVPVTVTLPAGFTGTSFTVKPADAGFTDTLFLDTLVVQP